MNRATWLAGLIGLIASFASGLACEDDDDDAAATTDDDNNDDNDSVADDDDDDNDDDNDDDDDNNDNNDDDDNDDTTIEPVIGCVEGDFAPYWGDMHAHTSYSDGELTPLEAFPYGRDEGELDVLIITDHVEQMFLSFPVLREYEKCQEAADEFYEPGVYLADCGFEFYNAIQLPSFETRGHVNVFFKKELAGWPYVVFTVAGLYNALQRCPTCIMQYNHPGSDPNQTWNNFEYFETADVQVNLIEMNGGDQTWDALFRALDAGWHVSPTLNQDNHDPNWGTRDDRRSGLFLADLTREELRDAMRARRSFATWDKNAWISLIADETCWMGSILSGYATLTLDVEAVDLDAGDDFASITFYGPGMTELATVDCAGQNPCVGNLDLEVTAPTYIVARAVQTDTQAIVSAPIWVAP
jgi:hypothetical protein